jgi:hypothetical protein
MFLAQTPSVVSVNLKNKDVATNSYQSELFWIAGAFAIAPKSRPHFVAV